MHGYPHAVLFDVVPDPFELLPEMAEPIKGANRVRGKGNEIRTYPEEQEAVLDVIFQNSSQTFKVVVDRLDQPLLGVGGQSKGGIGGAANRPIYTGITQFHRDNLTRYGT
jgi:hypothetical protein